MSATWIGLIGALVGTLFGGLITFITNWQRIQNEDRINKRNIYLDKLEEAYSYLTRVKHAAGVLKTSSIIKLAHGYDDMKKLNEEVPVEQAIMLIRFYSSHLEDELNPLEAQWIKVSESIGQVIFSQKLTDEEKGELIIKVSKEVGFLSDLITVLQQKLAHHVKSFL